MPEWVEIDLSKNACCKLRCLDRSRFLTKHGAELKARTMDNSAFGALLAEFLNLGGSLNGPICNESTRDKRKGAQGNKGQDGVLGQVWSL